MREAPSVLLPEAPRTTHIVVIRRRQQRQSSVRAVRCQTR